MSNSQESVQTRQDLRFVNLLVGVHDKARDIYANLLAEISGSNGMPEPSKVVSVNNAGIDICNVEDLEIDLGQFLLINTGLRVTVEQSGYHLYLQPRSSLFNKYGLLLVNSPGLIDQSYSGPEDYIKAPVFRAYQDYTNHQRGVPLKIPAGTRLFQLVIQHTIPVLQVKALANSGPNRGGFGSTDRK